MSDIQQITNVPIVAHAFNKDRTKLAVCPNSNEVYILEKQGNSWNHVHTLSEHDKLVTGIDWAPNSNRIVTCSQDRNAYVWSWNDGEKAWKPTLVVLRINRAATQVKWSPKEDKFAVSSGARCISVCYFEKDNDWWVSKHIKKPIRSTVLSVDWHPNNVLIACGCADFKARVYSGYIKEIDEKPGQCSWGSKFPFGDVLAEFGNTNGGWVHDVAFSPDGESIAWVSHDSSFSVVTGAGATPFTLRLNELPFKYLIWITGNSIIAAGYDANPTLLVKDGAGWKVSAKLDAGSESDGKDKGSSAMNKFKQMDSRGQESGDDTVLKTLHQNAISGLLAHTGGKGAITKFTTIGIDGKLIFWDVKK